MPKPLVSVIIPTFNRGYIIGAAIESILAQTYENWELLVIDDGSTDNTAKVVAGVKDARVNYLHQANAGPCAARNFGIEHANGKWVCYLDSDDILFSNCLQVMVTALEAHPDKVFGLPRGKRSLDLLQDGKVVKSVDDSDDMPHAFTVKDIFMRNARFACLGFFHLRRLYDEGLPWDSAVKAMEDWEFLMSIGEKYPDGFLYVPEVLYDYHQRFGGDGRCSASSYATWAEVFEYVFQKHRNDRMMAGQDWYPAKADKWRRRQALYEVGKLPAYQNHYFQT